MLGNIFIDILSLKHKRISQQSLTAILTAMISFKGMHNTVTVWTDDGKQKLREHYLVMHLWEAHQLFCQLCPTEGDYNIISFSKFCSIHPKNVLMTGDILQYQCKCMIHEYSSSWSLRHWETAMTGMKVIFHLGNIIQLVCWVHTCHTLFGVYILATCLKHKLVS